MREVDHSAIQSNIGFLQLVGWRTSDQNRMLVRSTSRKHRMERFCTEGREMERRRMKERRGAKHWDLGGEAAGFLRLFARSQFWALSQRRFSGRAGDGLVHLYAGIYQSSLLSVVENLRGSPHLIM